MTSMPRRAGLCLGATLLAATAACTASPRYPIEAGGVSGDGGLHMTQRPQYPIEHDAGGDARRGIDRDRAAAPPARTPPSPYPESDDAPRAAPSAPVDRTDLPPTAPRAERLSSLSLRNGGMGPSRIFRDGEGGCSRAIRCGRAAPSTPFGGPPPPLRRGGPEAAIFEYAGGWALHPFVSDTGVGFEDVGNGFELAAYRHRRHRGASSQEASTGGDDQEPKPSRHGRRRHGRSTPVAKEEAEPASPAVAATDTPYQTTVRPGEKLSDVAERVHASRQSLLELNGLKRSSHVKPGTVVKVPYRYSYQVGKGDTLYAISHRFNQDTEALAKANGVKHAAALKLGQTITLPVTAEDLGTRQHAEGSAPQPQAAPPDLIAAELKKAERTERRLGSRHDRASREATTSTEVAEGSDHPLSRRERRREARLERAQAAEARRAAEKASASTEIAQASERPMSRRERRREERRERAEAAHTERLAAAAPVRGGHEWVNTGEPTPKPPAQLAQEPVPFDSGTPAPPHPTSVGPVTASSVSAEHSPNALVATGPLRSTWVGPTAPQPSAPLPHPYAAPEAPVTNQAHDQPAPTSPSPASSYTPGRVASLNPPTYAGPALGRTRPSVPVLSSGSVSNSEVASAAQGRFVWPLHGAILLPFGDSGPGQRNNGVDIAAEAGAGVHAAASGEVVYAGSSIPGYGNLILIKHPGGWVTAYAHLDRIEVRMRDAVSQGDEIGQAGQTGAVTRPQLYFEVRYAPSAAEKARPVDPQLVLPAAG